MDFGAAMKNWLTRVAGRRYTPLLAFLTLSIAVATLGFMFVRHATTELLEAEARTDAENWASYLARNIPDLPQIAEGQLPSSATIALLEQARHAGRIYSFRVYDRQGLLKLRSDDFSKTLSRNQPIAIIDRDLADAIRGENIATRVHEGTAIGEPAYYTSTILPISDGRRTAGWLVTNVNQTDRRAVFINMATTVWIVVTSLLALGPLLGFWYSSRQKRSADRKIENISQHDQLTGLKNRQAFVNKVQMHLSAPDENAALIVCEIADLSSIGQNFGQETADHLATTTGERLLKMTPDGATPGRLDTARFGLFLANIDDPMSVLSLAKDLTTRLCEPADWQGVRVPVRVHTGIGLSKTDGRDAAALLRSAELALHAAEEQGTPGYGFFNPEIAQTARRRADLQRAVANAVDAQSFRLDFQPVYNIRNGELTGFEALIRLDDPELGSISPTEFIPIAEQSGLINRIGAWCLEEACRVASQWPPHLMVAVNLSPAQFYSGALISDVQHALQRNSFPSYRLEVEITEGTLLKETGLVLEQLRMLRDAGVSVALDDFGTGYSSMSYLWKFPFSKLKIDRSFVQALDEAQSARGILRSIIKLGHGLGLIVTAEGIETNKQFLALRDLGCDMAQGYLLDRPARIEDLAAIILRNFAKGLTGRARALSEAQKPSGRLEGLANA